MAGTCFEQPAWNRLYYLLKCSVRRPQPGTSQSGHQLAENASNRIPAHHQDSAKARCGSGVFRTS
jgi:hypothetical protein